MIGGATAAAAPAAHVRDAAAVAPADFVGAAAAKLMAHQGQMHRRQVEAPRERGAAQKLNGRQSLLEQDTSETFRFTSTGEAPAANPSLFVKYPLRAEQRRSLAWMLKQEQSSASHLRGGLLADCMGYGKTATTIGLVSVAGSTGTKTAPKGYLRLQSTLIVCPAHLLLQWQEEFLKFLGEEAVSIWRPNPDTNRRTLSVPLSTYPDLSTTSAPVGIRYKEAPWSKGTDIHTVWYTGLLVLEVFGSVCAYNSQTFDEGATIKSGDMIVGIHINPRGTTWTYTYESMAAFLATASLTDLLRVRFDVMKPANTDTLRKVRGSGPMRILVLERLSDLELLKCKDLLDGNVSVVLAAASIQRSQRYIGSIRNQTCTLLGGGKELQESKTDWVVKTHREVIGDKQHSDCRLLMPFFESFWWSRLVLDEFHESESWDFRSRELMKAVGAEHRWGLSGTPPFGSIESAALVAELLHYQGAASMQTYLALKRQRRTKWCEDPEHVAAMRAELQTFLDGHVRQNKSDLVEAIGVREHEELVDLTPEERLLYRQACHDHDIFDLEQGYQDVSVEKRAVLLQRCAHFDLHAAAVSAGDAVRHLGGAKREHLRMASEQLRIELSRAAYFKMLPDAHDALRGMQHEKAKPIASTLADLPADVLEKECLDSNLQVEIEHYDQKGERRSRPEVRLVQPIKEREYLGGSEAHRHAWVHAVARQRDRAAARILDGAKICKHACKDHKVPQAATMRAAVLGAAGVLDAAHRSLEFYEKQLRIVSCSATGETCPICLDDLDDARSLGILPCAHVFHTACIRENVRERKECPTCRRSCDVRHISPMVVELAEPAPEALRSVILPKLQAHGSKLNAMAGVLTQIRTEDPSAKAIVFMQWAALEAKVALALSAHGHKFVTLNWHGSCASNGKVLRQFQESTAEDDPRILLLSLESAASGTNLTAANHVLFVHPMNAETVARAAAYEKQALGRVRRVGQQRKEVHVWRFVTRETVESHIWDLHRTAIESDEDAGMSEEDAGGTLPQTLPRLVAKRRVDAGVVGPERPGLLAHGSKRMRLRNLGGVSGGNVEVLHGGVRQYDPTAASSATAQPSLGNVAAALANSGVDGVIQGGGSSVAAHDQAGKLNPLDLVYDIVCHLSKQEGDDVQGSPWVRMDHIVSMAAHKRITKDMVEEGVSNWESLSAMRRNTERTMVKFIMPL